MKGFERFQGPIFTPGQPGYDEERTGFNLAHPHHPAVVAGATCTEDVVLAERAAADRGLPVAVQATGHGKRDHLEGGVLITTGRMRGLHIDPQACVARVEAGVRAGEVVAAAAEHGLAPRNGSSPGVGVVGYTLAGGLGLLGRSLGWAADHTRALEVVSAGGELDVVTAMELDLVPLTTVYGGSVTFDGGDAATVLETWLDWTRTAPREVSSSVGMVTLPGLSIVSVRLALLGDEATGTRLAAPLRAAAPVLADTLRVLPWTESATIASDPPGAHPYQGTGVMLRSLDSRALRTILDGAGPGAPVDTVVQIHLLGGALAEPPCVPNAVAHRDAAYLLSLLSLVDEHGPARPAQAHEAVITALAPRPLGRYPGFQFGATWRGWCGGHRGSGRRSPRGRIR